MFYLVLCYLVLLLLVQLFERQASLLVLAALVLEPDANHARTEPGHLHQLLLHQSVRPRVGRVTGAQRVKLFLVQYRSYPSRLRLPAAVPRPGSAARPSAARPVRAGGGVVDGGTSRLAGTSVRAGPRSAVDN